MESERRRTILDNALDSLYREIILEHSKEPRNFGLLENYDLKREGFNPVCGDQIQLMLKFSPQKDKISHCMFSGQGCSICMASTSILTECIQNESVDHTFCLIDSFRSLMKGEKPQLELDEEIRALEGVQKFPVRIKCALLGWMTLKEALESASKGGESDVTKTE